MICYVAVDNGSSRKYQKIIFFSPVSTKLSGKTINIYQDLGDGQIEIYLNSLPIPPQMELFPARLFLSFLSETLGIERS